jgi:hypothetical protein
MFDQYTRNQHRSRMNWPLFGIVIVGLVIGGWLLLQAKERKERHDLEEMSSLFESATPPREIVEGKPIVLQLPGMSLEVTGELAITGDYDHGDATRDTWKITWTPNTKLAAADDVPVQVRYIAERTGSTAGPVRTITLDQAPAFEINFDGAARGTLIISTCGERSIAIFSDDPIATVRAKETFRCAPHAGRLVYHSAAVSPRAGWTQIPDTITTQLKSDRDVEMVLLAATKNTITLKVFDHAFDLDPAIEHHGVYSIRHGTVHRSDNSAHPGALVTWSCPALGATGYAYISQVGSTGLADGIALAETGRCLAPSEPAPRY